MLRIGGVLGSIVFGHEEIQELSVDRNHYSISIGISSSHGPRNNHTIMLRRWIVSPYNRIYRMWETFLVIFVIYTAWMSPFEFGFIKKPDRLLTILDNCVNALFSVDIVLTFFVAYLDKNAYLLVDNPKQIAWKYTTSWFAFDVISSIPSELSIMIIPSSFGRVFKMLRLWRLRRISAMFSRLEEDRNFNYFWVWCVKILCVTLFVVHCAGCFYYLLAVHYHDPRSTWIGASMENFLKESLWVRYVTSIYWSITILTSVGSLQPENTREMAIVIFYMLFNLWLSAYLTGNMTKVMAHRRSRTKNFRDTIQATLRFADRNQLPSHLRDQMLAHLCLKDIMNSEGLQQQEILESFPKAIRSSILFCLFHSLVDNAYLFDGVSNDLLFQLVSEMKVEVFPSKGNVILQSELSTDFYILISGALDIILNHGDGEQVVGEAKPGDVCGEIGVLCYRPQLFTVRTKCLSQLLCLKRTTFLNIIQGNIRDGTIIMNNIFQQLKDSDDPFMESILLEAEHMLAHGRIDLPLSLYFATLIGSDLLLNPLLRQGLDPNEVDDKGRTSLHIAASKGSENHVLLLLNYEADPNKRDLDGNVPLWEAILGGYEHIIKLLLEKDAKLSSGDVGQFSCIAAEQNNLNLLKEIARYGGDVTCSNTNGNTALHIAVSKGNVEIVKFLVN